MGGRRHLHLRLIEDADVLDANGARPRCRRRSKRAAVGFAPAGLALARIDQYSSYPRMVSD
jgi:hypothetical protein